MENCEKNAVFWTIYNFWILEFEWVFDGFWFVEFILLIFVGICLIFRVFGAMETPGVWNSIWRMASRGQKLWIFLTRVSNVKSIQTRGKYWRKFMFLEFFGKFSKYRKKWKESHQEESQALQNKIARNFPINPNRSSIPKKAIKITHNCNRSN